MKHYFDDVLKNGVLALEACQEPELYITKLWVHLHVVDVSISSEMCTDTDLYVEIDDEPVFLITFTGAWLQLKPIGKEDDDMQTWYDKWANHDSFHKILGCVFMQLKFTGDVDLFKINKED